MNDKYKYPNTINNSYIVIPKNGSSTIGRYMRPHSTIVDSNVALLHRDRGLKSIAEYADDFIYTFSRNPYKRVVSCYEYILASTPYAEPDLKVVVDELNIRDGFSNKEEFSFDRFVNIIIQQICPKGQSHPVWSLYWEPQTSYFLDSKNNLTVDYLGKLQTLEKDINEIARLIGAGELIEPVVKKGFAPKPSFIELIKFKPPHVNSSTWRHQDYKKYFNDDTRKKVEKYYEKDLEFLKVKF